MKKNYLANITPDKFNLTPGTFVVNEDKEKEWGYGQVQSSIDDKITINFQNVGKKTVISHKVKLKIIKI